MGEWIPAVAASGATALVTYLLARRKASGRVNTTEADRLWDERERHTRKLLRDNRALEIHVLEKRLENHYLRNQLTTANFAVAGNVPEDLQKKLRTMAQAHIKELKKALEAKRAEPLNGNGNGGK